MAKPVSVFRALSDMGLPIRLAPTKLFFGPTGFKVLAGTGILVSFGEGTGGGPMDPRGARLRDVDRSLFPVDEPRLCRAEGKEGTDVRLGFKVLIPLGGGVKSGEVGRDAKGVGMDEGFPAEPGSDALPAVRLTAAK